jgi:hypothetical protein
MQGTTPKQPQAKAAQSSAQTTTSEQPSANQLAAVAALLAGSRPDKSPAELVHEARWIFAAIHQELNRPPPPPVTMLPEDLIEKAGITLRVASWQKVTGGGKEIQVDDS